MTTQTTTHFTDTKEFYDLRNNFEQIYRSERLDREPKELSSKQVFYQDGAVNSLFIGFMNGYQLGRINYMN